MNCFSCSLALVPGTPSIIWLIILMIEMFLLTWDSVSFSLVSSLLSVFLTTDYLSNWTKAGKVSRAKRARDDEKLFFGVFWSRSVGCKTKNSSMGRNIRWSGLGISKACCCDWSISFCSDEAACIILWIFLSPFSLWVSDIEHNNLKKCWSSLYAWSSHE